MTDPVIIYATGVLSGMAAALVLVVVHDRPTNPDMRDLAVEATTQAVFIRATSDVVDEETGAAIQSRTNELLDEYDVPGDPVLGYDPEGDSDV